jgi:hypothetical protein
VVFVLAVSALAALIVYWPRGSTPAVPGEPPSIRGTITKVNGSGISGSVLVEENPQEQAGSAKANVTVNAATRIYLGQGSAASTGQFADLLTGRRVEVWFTGPVLQSYPLQGTAGVIVILNP